MLAELSATDLLPVAGAILLTMWMTIKLRKRRRNQLPDVTPTEQLERHRQARGMRGDLEEVMVEVEQLARRFGSQLDAKSVQLTKLIAEADERIARLESLEKGAGQRGDGPSPRQTAPDAPARPGVPEDELTRNVYRLADAGNSSLEIAQTLKEHVGKVELILALRNA